VTARSKELETLLESIAEDDAKGEMGSGAAVESRSNPDTDAARENVRSFYSSVATTLNGHRLTSEDRNRSRS
jgi:hypothetical protein